jgi:hypothetical protein
LSAVELSGWKKHYLNSWTLVNAGISKKNLQNSQTIQKRCFWFENKSFLSAEAFFMRCEDFLKLTSYYFDSLLLGENKKRLKIYAAALLQALQVAFKKYKTVLPKLLYLASPF